MAKKYYAVKVGLTPGVYMNWADCKAQVDGFSGATYKSFPTLEEAQAFVGISQGAKNETESASVPNVSSDFKEQSFQSQSHSQAGVIAYVDGSYLDSVKEFSYGAVILKDGQEICLNGKMSDPDLVGMRNVAGEIKGAETAMRYALENEIDEITIVHDYEGIAKWCLGQWKTNKEGTKAYKAFYDSIQDRLTVHFQKVKGHSGDHYNDMADELAKKALGILE